MSLSGKIVAQTEIKSDGNVFYEIFRYRPHQLSNMSPDKIQSCDIKKGQWGTVGSIICWNYTVDGKETVTKDIIEAIDEEMKSITFKVFEGDILDLFKTMILTLDVDTHGESNLVTWTLEYEKVNENVEDPNSLIDFCVQLTKDIEAHHLK